MLVLWLASCLTLWRYIPDNIGWTNNLSKTQNPIHSHSCSLSLSLSLAKEEVLYIKEAKQQEEKIERLKAEAGDEYVIKKQVRRIIHLKQHTT